MVKLTSYAEALKKTEAQKEEAAIPLLVKEQNAKHTLAVVKAEQELASLETRLIKLNNSKELDFSTIVETVGAISVAEKKLAVLKDVGASLFPTA